MSEMLQESKKLYNSLLEYIIFIGFKPYWTRKPEIFGLAFVTLEYYIERTALRLLY